MLYNSNQIKNIKNIKNSYGITPMQTNEIINYFGQLDVILTKKDFIKPTQLVIQRFYMQLLSIYRDSSLSLTNESTSNNNSSCSNNNSSCSNNNSSCNNNNSSCSNNNSSCNTLPSSCNTLSPSSSSSCSTLSFIKILSDFLSTIGLSNLSLKEILCPESRNFIIICTYIVNFSMYRDTLRGRYEKSCELVNSNIKIMKNYKNKIFSLKEDKYKLEELLRVNFSKISNLNEDCQDLGLEVDKLKKVIQVNLQVEEKEIEEEEIKEEEIEVEEIEEDNKVDDNVRNDIDTNDINIDESKYGVENVVSVSPPSVSPTSPPSVSPPSPPSPPSGFQKIKLSLNKLNDKLCSNEMIKLNLKNEIDLFNKQIVSNPEELIILVKELKEILKLNNCEIKNINESKLQIRKEINNLEERIKKIKEIYNLIKNNEEIKKNFLEYENINKNINENKYFTIKSKIKCKLIKYNHIKKQIELVKLKIKRISEKDKEISKDLEIKMEKVKKEYEELCRNKSIVGQEININKRKTQNLMYNKSKIEHNFTKECNEIYGILVNLLTSIEIMRRRSD